LETDTYFGTVPIKFEIEKKASKNDVLNLRIFK